MAQNTDKKNAQVTEKKATRTNANNRTNGKFTLVRRNDNRVRVVSDGKTIATLEVGKNKSSIAVPGKDAFNKLSAKMKEAITEGNYGPNKFKVPVDTKDLDTVARKLFGECDELIVEKKEEKAGEKKEVAKKPAKKEQAKKEKKVFVEVKDGQPVEK